MNTIFYLIGDALDNCSLVIDGFDRDILFNPDSKLIRDNGYAPWITLRDVFLGHQLRLHTADVNAGKKVAFELHIDVQRKSCDVPAYVVLLETPQIKPDNQRKDLLAKYRRVFTWNDDLVDGERYIKINFLNKIIVDVSRGWLGRDRMCCMIAGNKAVRQFSPLELYSERVKTIRWFEQHAPQNFDLYGVGWDVPAAKSGLVGKVIHRLQRATLPKVGGVFFPSHHGKVNSKLETLRKYRFSICYENVRDLPGYITEKIFDSFFAGCIPVYWGASNISTYIPEDCFIDRRKFPTHEQLYQFMVSMTLEEYIVYQERIAAFLTSDRAKPFSAELFAETIANIVVNDLGIAA